MGVPPPLSFKAIHFPPSFKVIRMQFRLIPMACLSLACLLSLSAVTRSQAADQWPPALPNAKDGTATIRSEMFLQVPKEFGTKPGGAEYTMAKTPPTVRLAFHDKLGPDAANRRLWSSWGDICVASDGRAYSAVGDHGDDAGGDARCFIYSWDPQRQVLEQVVDVNAHLPDTKPHSKWSKIHAKIDEGPDGKIYYSGTFNDGNKAGTEKYHFSEKVPGGQLYRYDPSSGKSEVFANLPPRRVTATSLVDPERGLWWCNLEAGEGQALFALDFKTGKPAFQSPDGTVGFNRNFALGRDGTIWFNGPETLMKYDPAKKAIVATKTVFPDASPGMRCSTHESKAGEIYGITHKTSMLFRLKTADGTVELLGPNWLAGSYTAVCAMSPDEKFVYFLPGSHGGAFKDGTPVVQYDIKSGQRKVLAFLAAACEKELDYVPAGTYGMKMSADGSKIYVNFNGHPTEKNRPAKMKPTGFGLTAFAEIEIPASER